MENLPEALVGVHLLRWIVTYPVDKVIHSLNNWGQVDHRRSRENFDYIKFNGPDSQVVLLTIK